MTPVLTYPRTTQGPVAAWRRFVAVLVKEFIQLRRDRVTLISMIFISLVQLLLFGYAINTDPKELRTAVLARGWRVKANSTT